MSKNRMGDSERESAFADMKTVTRFAASIIAVVAGCTLCATGFAPGPEAYCSPSPCPIAVLPLLPKVSYPPNIPEMALGVALMVGGLSAAIRAARIFGPFSIDPPNAVFDYNRPQMRPMATVKGAPIAMEPSEIGGEAALVESAAPEQICCPDCGAPNQFGAAHCANCGETLPQV